VIELPYIFVETLIYAVLVYFSFLMGVAYALGLKKA
jgi:hypothetical protein